MMSLCAVVFEPTHAGEDVDAIRKSTGETREKKNMKAHRADCSVVDRWWHKTLTECSGKCALTENFSTQ